MRVFIFGDSIVQGFFDSRGGWAQRLASALHMQTLKSMREDGGFYVEVHNLGISGDDVEGVINRIEIEVDDRRLYEDDDLIIIAIGTNDAILRDNIAIHDVYEFQEKLEKLVGIAKDITDKILLVGIPPVEESLTDPWEYSSSGKQWKNNRINLFEDTVKQVAINQDINFVPIHDAYLQAMSKGHKLHSDGLHPNDAGHELIYQSVKPILEEMLNES